MVITPYGDRKQGVDYWRYLDEMDMFGSNGTG